MDLSHPHDDNRLNQAGDDVEVSLNSLLPATRSQRAQTVAQPLRPVTRPSRTGSDASHTMTSYPRNGNNTEPNFKIATQRAFQSAHVNNESNTYHDVSETIARDPINTNDRLSRLPSHYDFQNSFDDTQSTLGSLGSSNYHVNFDSSLSSAVSTPCSRNSAPNVSRIRNLSDSHTSINTSNTTLTGSMTHTLNTSISESRLYPSYSVDLAAMSIENPSVNNDINENHFSSHHNRENSRGILSNNNVKTTMSCNTSFLGDDAFSTATSHSGPAPKVQRNQQKSVPSIEARRQSIIMSQTPYSPSLSSVTSTISGNGVYKQGQGQNTMNPFHTDGNISSHIVGSTMNYLATPIPNGLDGLNGLNSSGASGMKSKISLVIHNEHFGSVPHNHSRTPESQFSSSLSQNHVQNAMATTPRTSLNSLNSVSSVSSINPVNPVNPVHGTQSVINSQYHFGENSNTSMSLDSSTLSVSSSVSDQSLSRGFSAIALTNPAHPTTVVSNHGNGLTKQYQGFNSPTNRENMINRHSRLNTIETPLSPTSSTSSTSSEHTVQHIVSYVDPPTNHGCTSGTKSSSAQTQGLISSRGFQRMNLGARITNTKSSDKKTTWTTSHDASFDGTSTARFGTLTRTINGESKTRYISQSGSQPMMTPKRNINTLDSTVPSVTNVSSSLPHSNFHSGMLPSIDPKLFDTFHQSGLESCVKSSQNRREEPNDLNDDEDSLEVVAGDVHPAGQELKSNQNSPTHAHSHMRQSETFGTSRTSNTASTFNIHHPSFANINIEQPNVSNVNVPFDQQSVTIENFKDNHPSGSSTLYYPSTTSVNSYLSDSNSSHIFQSTQTQSMKRTLDNPGVSYAGHIPFSGNCGYQNRYISSHAHTQSLSHSQLSHHHSHSLTSSLGETPRERSISPNLRFQAGQIPGQSAFFPTSSHTLPLPHFQSGLSTNFNSLGRHPDTMKPILNLDSPSGSSHQSIVSQSSSIVKPLLAHMGSNSSSTTNASQLGKIPSQLPKDISTATSLVSAPISSLSSLISVSTSISSMSSSSTSSNSTVTTSLPHPIPLPLPMSMHMVPPTSVPTTTTTSTPLILPDLTATVSSSEVPPTQVVTQSTGLFTEDSFDCSRTTVGRLPRNERLWTQTAPEGDFEFGVRCEPDGSISNSYVRVLPRAAVSNNKIDSISAQTLCDLLMGKYDYCLERFIIIDCRYYYEFVNGHIQTAINVTSPRGVQAVYSRLLQYALPHHAIPFDSEIVDMKSGKTATSRSEAKSKQDHTIAIDRLHPSSPIRLKKCPIAIIFHCEYSHSRGPTSAQLFRTLDREVQMYPTLAFPEMVVLHGGYRQFYSSYRYFCDGSYISMWDTRFKHLLQKYYSRHRALWKLGSSSDANYEIYWWICLELKRMYAKRKDTAQSILNLKSSDRVIQAENTVETEDNLSMKLHIESKQTEMCGISQNDEMDDSTTSCDIESNSNEDTKMENSHEATMTCLRGIPCGPLFPLILNSYTDVSIPHLLKDLKTKTQLSLSTQSHNRSNDRSFSQMGSRKKPIDALAVVAELIGSGKIRVLASYFLSCCYLGFRGGTSSLPSSSSTSFSSFSESTTIKTSEHKTNMKKTSSTTSLLQLVDFNNFPTLTQEELCAPFDSVSSMVKLKPPPLTSKILRLHQRTNSTSSTSSYAISATSTTPEAPPMSPDFTYSEGHTLEQLPSTIAPDAALLTAIQSSPGSTSIQGRQSYIELPRYHNPFHPNQLHNYANTTSSTTSVERVLSSTSVSAPTVSTLSAPASLHQSTFTNISGNFNSLSSTTVNTNTFGNGIGVGSTVGIGITKPHGKSADFLTAPGKQYESSFQHLSCLPVFQGVSPNFAQGSIDSDNTSLGLDRPPPKYSAPATLASSFLSELSTTTRKPCYSDLEEVLNSDDDSDVEDEDEDEDDDNDDVVNLTSEFVKKPHDICERRQINNIKLKTTRDMGDDMGDEKDDDLVGSLNNPPQHVLDSLQHLGVKISRTYKSGSKTKHSKNVKNDKRDKSGKCEKSSNHQMRRLSNGERNPLFVSTTEKRDKKMRELNKENKRRMQKAVSLAKNTNIVPPTASYITSSIPSSSTNTTSETTPSTLSPSSSSSSSSSSTISQSLHFTSTMGISGRDGLETPSETLSNLTINAHTPLAMLSFMGHTMTFPSHFSQGTTRSFPPNENIHENDFEVGAEPEAETQSKEFVPSVARSSTTSLNLRLGFGMNSSTSPSAQHHALSHHSTHQPNVANTILAHSFSHASNTVFSTSRTATSSALRMPHAVDTNDKYDISAANTSTSIMPLERKNRHDGALFYVASAPFQTNCDSLETPSSTKTGYPVLSSLLTGPKSFYKSTSSVSDASFVSANVSTTSLLTSHTNTINGASYNVVNSDAIQADWFYGSKSQGLPSSCHLQQMDKENSTHQRHFNNKENGENFTDSFRTFPCMNQALTHSAVLPSDFAMSSTLYQQPTLNETFDVKSNDSHPEKPLTPRVTNYWELRREQLCLKYRFISSSTPHTPLFTGLSEQIELDPFVVRFLDVCSDSDDETLPVTWPVGLDFGHDIAIPAEAIENHKKEVEVSDSISWSDRGSDSSVYNGKRSTISRSSIQWSNFIYLVNDDALEALEDLLVPIKTIMRSVIQIRFSLSSIHEMWKHISAADAYKRYVVECIRKGYRFNINFIKREIGQCFSLRLINNAQRLALVGTTAPQFEQNPQCQRQLGNCTNYVDISQTTANTKDDSTALNILLQRLGLNFRVGVCDQTILDPNKPNGSGYIPHPRSSREQIISRTIHNSSLNTSISALDTLNMSTAQAISHHFLSPQPTRTVSASTTISSSMSSTSSIPPLCFFSPPNTNTRPVLESQYQTQFDHNNLVSTLSAPSHASHVSSMSVVTTPQHSVHFPPLEETPASNTKKSGNFLRSMALSDEDEGQSVKAMDSMICFESSPTLRRTTLPTPDMDDDDDEITLPSMNSNTMTSTSLLFPSTSSLTMKPISFLPLSGQTSQSSQISFSARSNMTGLHGNAFHSIHNNAAIHAISGPYANSCLNSLNTNSHSHSSSLSLSLFCDLSSQQSLPPRPLPVPPGLESEPIAPVSSGFKDYVTSNSMMGDIGSPPVAPKPRHMKKQSQTSTFSTACHLTEEEDNNDNYDHHIQTDSTLVKSERNEIIEFTNSPLPSLEHFLEDAALLYSLGKKEKDEQTKESLQKVETSAKELFCSSFISNGDCNGLNTVDSGDNISPEIILQRNQYKTLQAFRLRLHEEQQPAKILEMMEKTPYQLSWKLLMVKKFALSDWISHKFPAFPQIDPCFIDDIKTVIANVKRNNLHFNNSS